MRLFHIKCCDWANAVCLWSAANGNSTKTGFWSQRAHLISISRGIPLKKNVLQLCDTLDSVCTLRSGLHVFDLRGKAFIKHPYGRLLVVMARTKRKKTNDSCFHCCQRFFANLLPCKIKVPVYVISVPDLSAPVTFRTALSLHIYPRFSVGGALQPALFSTFAVFSFSLVTFSSYSFPSQAS